MNNITIKEPGADDFFPCAAEINFGESSFRCALGCGHGGNHEVECLNQPVILTKPNRCGTSIDIKISWGHRS